jgi:very-short-patch-repair endonuclease
VSIFCGTKIGPMKNKELIAEQRRTTREVKDDRKIICKECGKAVGVKGFPTHVKKLHKIEFKYYVQLNLKDFEQYGWRSCCVCKRGVGKMTNEGQESVTCSKDCFRQFRKDYLRENGNGWEGKEHTEDSRRKISENNKQYYSQHQHPWKNRKHTDETCKKMSELAKERASQPDYVNPMQGKIHTPESIAKICKDRVGSSLEVLTRSVLDEAGFPYTHQFFIIFNGRSYSFDFKLKDLPIVIEVDGDYWHGGSGVKKHFFDVDRIKKVDREKENVAKSRNYHLVRVWESELKNDPQLLLERIRNARIKSNTG